MKTIRPLFPEIVLCLIGALLGGCSTYSHPQPLPIAVERMKRAPLYSVDGDNWRPMEKRAVFKQGITIQTGAESFMDIAFDKKPRRQGPFSPRDEMASLDHSPFKNVRIFENTSLKIEKAERVNHWSWAGDTFNEQIRLKLLAGQIGGNTISSGTNPGYEVGFTNGTVAFSNKTRYLVSASGIVDVVEGTASVFLADKHTIHKVSSGHTFDPATGADGKLSSTQIQTLRILTMDFGPEFEWVTKPPILGQGLGMGGALRIFP